MMQVGERTCREYQEKFIRANIAANLKERAEQEQQEKESEDRNQKAEIRTTKN